MPTMPRPNGKAMKIAKKLNPNVGELSHVKFMNKKVRSDLKQQYMR
jgi:hypothetical protein